MSIACPKCSKPMRQEMLPEQIEIDICADHGVWLDAGELERIRADFSAEARADRDASSPRWSDQVGDFARDQGKRFIDSTTFGAGATLGSRIMSGILRAIFGDR